MAVKGLDFTDEDTDRYILNYVYAKVGMVDKAQERLDRMLQLDDKGPVLGYIVETYAALGETDRALEWLEKAFLSGNSYMYELSERRALDSIRSDPRYIALAKKMGLEP
jgi:tetratricopeptide (TPR) repeat protein